MVSHKANINPEILAWAREEAGLSLSDAADQGKVSALKDKTAEQRLVEWEQGAEKPTQNQLSNIAKAYYRPILTFYLPVPPAPDAEVADFRTIADEEMGKLPPKLRALVSKMIARQQEILELFKSDDDEDEAPKSIPFIGRFNVERDVGAVAKDIEDELNLPLGERRQLNDNDALLKLIRLRAEERGVFVLAQGDLGSYHTDIDPTVFRGFALADPIVPFVVLNDNDAKPAQTFTLIHELAHLWIGETGISNFDPFNGRGHSTEDEKFCNSVSAEFLMPRAEIAEIWNMRRALPLAEAIREVAREFGVSRAAAGIRLWSFGEIEDNAWWQLFEGYKREWAEAKRRREEARDGPAPIYYPAKKSQLGGLLISTVLNALDAGQVTYTRASRILGVSPDGFENLRPRAN